jgi:hypothetical protein
MLGEDTHDRPNATLAEGADIEVFVKIGRNASSSNRQALETAGLHWHGRQAGWVGVVTAAQLAELRRTFGGRVEEPEQVGAGENPALPVEDAPEAVSVDAEAVAAAAGEEQGRVDRAVSEEQSVSAEMTSLRTSFGFPPRSPTVT